MLKLSLKYRRNMSTHSYSIKSLQNNFITLLYLYKPLNYKSNSMRNNHIFFEDNVIIFAKKLYNRRNKKRLSEQREIIEH